MQFNHLVTLASDHNLTIRTTYQTSGHGLNKIDVLNYFFASQTMAALPKNTTCSHKKSTIESIPAEVLQAKKETKCIVFMVALKPNERGMEVNLPYYRRIFEGNEYTRKSVIKRKWKEPDVVYVAVHIRRGDLLGYLKGYRKSGQITQTEQRLLEIDAYTTVLNQLLRKLARLEKYKVEVRLYCEGMQPPALIQNASNWKMVDLREEITFDHSVQNVTIMPGTGDTLQAFDDMCFSNVIITGTSGFSHLASIMCKTHVVLGFPFWHSYDYIPNAITLDVGRGDLSPVPSIGVSSARLINSASFNETRFELLWRERFKSDAR